MTLEEYRQIAELTKYNYNIIQLYDAEKNVEWWSCTEFDPSTSATSSSVDYNAFVGQNITEFIKRNKIEVQNNIIVYIQQFQAYVDPLPKIRVKFGKYQSYYFYGK